MLASLVIVFREVIEAGLIVGIVLAATRSVPRRSWWIAGGVAVGTLGACVVAGFAGELGARRVLVVSGLSFSGCCVIFRCICCRRVGAESLPVV